MQFTLAKHVQNENIISSCEVFVDGLVLQLFKVGGNHFPKLCKCVCVRVIVIVLSFHDCVTSPARPSSLSLLFKFVPGVGSLC